VVAGDREVRAQSLWIVRLKCQLKGSRFLILSQMQAFSKNRIIKQQY